MVYYRKNKNSKCKTKTRPFISRIFRRSSSVGFLAKIGSSQSAL